MRIAFTTLGCKINQCETDRMQRELAAAGNTIVPRDHPADIHVVNTCSVTSRTDYQCRQAIRSAVKSAPGAKVVVTGCYAQVSPDELRRVPGVHLVIGNAEKDCIKEHVRSLAPGVPPGGTSSLQQDIPGIELTGGRTRGFLKIQDGCNSRCSYCIVPRARGRSRSVPEQDVFQSFDDLVGNQCPEIVLSGVHIGKYGDDLQPRTTLESLLRSLGEKRGNSRLRLSSIEPREISEGIVELLGNVICRHLHIPLQSGDDSILSAMNREYSSGFYRELLARIADRVPGAALGADVMVGFPGEGEKEFRNTYLLIEQSPLSHLHVFSFSPRPGTPAAKLPGQVAEQIKKERNAALRELGEKKSIEFRKKTLQKVLPVVIEGKIDASHGCLSGLSDNYIRVTVQDASPEDIGKELRVTITDVRNESTCGIRASETTRV